MSGLFDRAADALVDHFWGMSGAMILDDNDPKVFELLDLTTQGDIDMRDVAEVAAKHVFESDELSYLIRILGGPSDQGIKSLGTGLNAVGAIALRHKLEAMRPKTNATKAD